MDNDIQKKHKRIVRQRIRAVIITLIVLGGLIAGAVFALPKLLSPILPDPEENGGANEEALSENAPEEEELTEEEMTGEEDETEIDPEVLKEQVEDALSEAEEESIDPEIQGMINVMTNEQKIAQLFFITPEALTKVDPTTAVGDRTKEVYRVSPVGGLIYFSKNLTDPGQTEDMLKEMQRCALSVNSLPVFLGVDEEGGETVRLAGNPAFALENTGSAAAIGEGGDPEKARTAGSSVGKYLSGYGFNIDFAPVADLAARSDPALGERSFGTEPEAAGKMAVNFARGLEENGVFACFKHFPGLGGAEENTDKAAVSVNKSLEELKSKDLIPFKEAVAAGAEFIMAGHAEYPGIDPGLPASMSSKFLKEILRDELGYEGIIISDALDAEAVTSRYSSGEAAVAAFNAGCDMLLMPKDFDEAYEAVLHAYENGDISNDRLMESLVRILTVKLKSGKLPVSSEQMADETKE